MEIKVDIKNTTNNQKKDFGENVLNHVERLGKFELSFGKFNDSLKESFYHDLFILLDSGMDIRLSLELLAKESNNPNIKDIISHIERDIVIGMKLSTSLSKKTEFGNYEVVNIQIGEETGRLKEVFRELSRFFSSKIRLKRQIISIISYPSFILLVTLGIVWFMLTVVVPMFTDIFAKLNGDLPELTKTVIAMSNFIQNYFVYLILFLFSLIVAFTTQKEKLWFRKWQAIIVLRIPVIGDLVKKIQLNRFSISMKMLLNSETPVLNSISLSEEMISFYPMKIALQEVKENLLNGKYLYQGLMNHNLFPNRYVTLIRVGEEVNQLAAMFEKISKQLDAEIEYQAEVLGKVLEPVMIIFIGIFVGFILIAMYLPLFELSTTIN